MYNTPKDLIDALHSTPDTLGALLRGLSQEKALATRGGDEGWSVVEVMCHLRDAEEKAIERVRTLRDELDPHIAGYNQDSWAQERNYAGDNLEKALAQWRQFRRQHITDLEGLSPEQWVQVGTHEEYGPIDITNHTLHMVSHDAQHMAQLARQLA